MSLPHSAAHPAHLWAGLLCSRAGLPLSLESTLGLPRMTTGLGMRGAASSPGPTSLTLRPRANPLCSNALDVCVYKGGIHGLPWLSDSMGKALV